MAGFVSFKHSNNDAGPESLKRHIQAIKARTDLLMISWVLLGHYEKILIVNDQYCRPYWMPCQVNLSDGCT